MSFNSSALIVGLTGQSGSGKTTLCSALSKASLGVIDCDKLSHEVISEKECAVLIARAFPEVIADGIVDRKLLGGIVFTDKARLAKLNGIIHPIIMLAVKKKISLLEKKYDIIILDAPTLFESGANRLCDITVGIISPAQLLTKRLAQRDGLDRQAVENRLKSQKSEDFFRQSCDIIIVNDNNSDELEKKANMLITELEALGNKKINTWRK